jgi:hypothetical protein
MSSMFEKSEELDKLSDPVIITLLSAAVSGIPVVCVLRFPRRKNQLLRHPFLVFQASPDRAFHEWVLEHEKDYINDEVEYGRRRAIWLDNFDFVHQYNEKYDSHWVCSSVSVANPRMCQALRARLHAFQLALFEGMSLMWHIF